MDLRIQKLISAAGMVKFLPPRMDWQPQVCTFIKRTMRASPLDSDRVAPTPVAYRRYDFVNSEWDEQRGLLVDIYEERI